MDMFSGGSFNMYPVPRQTFPTEDELRAVELFLRADDYDSIQTDGMSEEKNEDDTSGLT